MAELRKYGVATTIKLSIFEVDGIDFRVDAVAVAGDITISKDEGTEANTTNLFVDEGNGYSILLSATEMQASRISLYFIDQTATKVWLDTAIEIETYGNASAQHAFDLGTASTAQTGDSYARIGAAGASLTAIDLPDQTMNITGNITGNLTGSVGSLTTNNDKTGYSISGTKTTLDALNDIAATAIVSAGAITTLSGAIVNVDLVDLCTLTTTTTTTTTNTDMRGTDSAFLAASAPSNFSSLAISVGGAISNVTLCATTTTNTDMRGTDSAATATNLATVDTNVDAILVDTGTTIPAQITALNNFNPASDTVANVTLVATTTTNTDMLTFSNIWTGQLTESYAADAVAPTPAQALFITMQNLQSFSFSGTTQTVRRIDDSTTASTYTLDSSTAPTSKERTT